GKRVIEALRPGVQFNTFRHFLDIDDLAAFRIRSCEEGENPKPKANEDINCLNDELRKEYLLKAFEQIGKDYDFAFDVNTEDKIVCSELIYRTFLDINFETTNTVGMYNISPDQVAKKGDDEGDLFTPIFFFHKGTLLEEKGEGLRSYIKNLMFPEEL
ncbi:MAG: YiiX/YebB-like N1pC/P60 family cysteine hydrolase, partial [Halobacteriovoraceae bacterium]|nr:YiiX/YebB-like N1pC/P60 family cysteine hydrolase [Halobacteriovoraceae bacterium]